MAIASSIILGLSLAAAAIGTGVSVYGSVQANNASKRAEKLREKQMNLEATRRQREIIRQRQVANSQALAVATAQGAAQGTGLQGGYGAVAGATGRQAVSTSQNTQIGSGIFQANAAADNAQSISAAGGGLSSLGQGVLNNYGVLQRVGFVT